MKEEEVGGPLLRMGEMRNSYKILIRKPEGKRRLGRSKCRWGQC